MFRLLYYTSLVYSVYKPNYRWPSLFRYGTQNTISQLISSYITSNKGNRVRIIHIDWEQSPVLALRHVCIYMYQHKKQRAGALQREKNNSISIFFRKSRCHSGHNNIPTLGVNLLNTLIVAAQDMVSLS
jgi:hypothetical protein